MAHIEAALRRGGVASACFWGRHDGCISGAMRNLLRSLFTALIVLVVARASAQQSPLHAVEADRIRIRAHLERVIEELRAADVSQLSDAQRDARATNIERLVAYRVRGEFPHGNAAQPGQRVPTFIDADGRACAMGQLVIESGAESVAREIAATQNYARVPQITHAALGGWLIVNGMSLAEATRVQPDYCFECDDAGIAAVCGADGLAYANACLAVCEGTTVAGPAVCSGASCSCLDGGAPDDAGTLGLDGGTTPIDAGTRVDSGITPLVDAGITPRIDAGGGGTVRPDDGGCSVGHGARGSAWAFSALVAALGALVRRRRRG